MRLKYAAAGQTVGSLQHLDPKQINLKIILFVRGQPHHLWLVVTVSRFKHVYGHGVYAIGRDTKKYDRVSISGRTLLYAYSG